MAEQDYWLRIARYFEFDFIEEPLVRIHSLTDLNHKSAVDNTVNVNSDVRKAFLEKHLPAMKREGVDSEFQI